MMTPEVQRIYDFVSKQEDLFYGGLKGDGGLSEMLTSVQAASFQKVRYFIETMEEREED